MELSDDALAAAESAMSLSGMTELHFTFEGCAFIARASHSGWTWDLTYAVEVAGSAPGAPFNSGDNIEPAKARRLRALLQITYPIYSGQENDEVSKKAASMAQRAAPSSHWFTRAEVVRLLAHDMQISEKRRAFTLSGSSR